MPPSGSQKNQNLQPGCTEFYNLCVDYLRKHSRVQTQEDFDESYLGEDLQVHTQDMEQQRASDAKLLNAAIDELPEQQRSALMLCHYGGFSNKEAAAIMKLSVKALESTISRARRSLRTQLEQTGLTRGETETIG